MSQQLVPILEENEAYPTTINQCIRKINSYFQTSQCPNCGATFKKKRTDQIACSRRCGNAIRARRFYKKWKAA